MDASKLRLSWVAAAVISIAVAVALVAGSDLPLWAWIGFVAAFPAYTLLLRALARSKMSDWERQRRARVERGEGPADPEDVLPKGALLRLYHPDLVFFERAAAMYRDAGHGHPAAKLFAAAARVAPEREQPRLAREIWASARRLPERERRAFVSAPVLELALAAPKAPWDLHQDFGDDLLERGSFEAAIAAYEAALGLATTNGQRFKLMTKLALATVRTGRFGAADGWLHEANEIMPTGDPGYEALYNRSLEQVAEAKRAHAEAGSFSLVQLLRDAGATGGSKGD